MKKTELTCKYCGRETPNKEFKTKKGKCIWCDKDYVKQEVKK